MRLSKLLVLNRYMIHQFGEKDFESLVHYLKTSDLEGLDENNVSRIYLELSRRLRPGAKVNRQQLYEYDQHIVSHTQAISQKRDQPIRWRYFQYLSLLFTELYLDKYFTDKEVLLEELNAFVDAFNDPNDRTVANEEGLTIPHFREKELNKLALWNATGSGKTLLMHVNIRQYLHYQEKRDATPVNKILLVTPKEGLSLQHLEEFRLSNITAESFSKNAGMAFGGPQVEVIEITKLAEESGDETVAVDAFETNNLVLIDEGHLGMGGVQWKQRRDQLSENGFAFEYSATFGQAVSAARSADKPVLIEEYAKSVLFDYSYKYFYHDGYGKDYHILNITDDGDESYLRRYMTGNLLAYYQQLLVYRDHPLDARTFNIEKPLWVFVGSKVTKSLSKTEASDVVQIVRFLTAFIKDSRRAKEDIQLILEGKDGLVNTDNISIFRGAFEYLQLKEPGIDALYADILKSIFNSSTIGANIYLDNLGGADGELGLRVGDTEQYFGVINVGDDSKLFKLCQEEDIPGQAKDFGSSLFHRINEEDSSVNVLIGAKKFTEGWSSWRVSCMGLMNVGTGEGSQIIQLFGRGVRLKGYQFSLKRSRGLDEFQRPKGKDPAHLPVLETLNIFGVRANYMQRFRDYLEEEGLPANDSNFEEIEIPTMPVIKLEDHKLKVIKLKQGVDFQADRMIRLAYEKFWNGKPPVIVDWLPRVQMVSSSRGGVQVETLPESHRLTPQHLAFLNWNEVYLELHQFKQERGWNNITFRVEDLRAIADQDSWYLLYIPEHFLKIRSFHQVRQWQEIVTALLKGYLERYYNHQKQAYESSHLELRTLDKEDDNLLEEYRILVEQSQTRIIRNLQKLKEVFAQVENQSFEIDQNFTAFSFIRHLYQPLLYIHNKQYRDLVKIAPVALNEGERQFVFDLKEYYEQNPAFFENRKLFLLRNMSRKGIGFFEANNFYPDFILWLVVGDHQYIAFLDPKGLRNINGLEHPKIAFYRTIKEVIEKRLDDPSVSLSSFILSNTPYDQIEHWKGQNSRTDFNQYNVYFQKEQSDYVQSILRKIVG